MTTQTHGRTRKRRVWPWVLLVAAVVMLVPASRELVLTWIGHAIAVVAGIFVTTLVMLSKPPPRR